MKAALPTLELLLFILGQKLCTWAQEGAQYVKSFEGLQRLDWADVSAAVQSEYEPVHGHQGLPV